MISHLNSNSDLKEDGHSGVKPAVEQDGVKLTSLVNDAKIVVAYNSVIVKTDDIVLVGTVIICVVVVVVVDVIVSVELIIIVDTSVTVSVL